MKRIFIFSYHGRDTHQTSFYRLLSLAKNLANHFEVYFIYGNVKNIEIEKNENSNFKEIPLTYHNGIIQKFHKYLNGKNLTIAKILLIFHYLFTRNEIFDIRKEFENYLENNRIELNQEDIVFVSFPSLAVHNLGYLLKKKFKSKLILEYRDPGVFGYRLVFENEFVSKMRKFFLRKKEIRNLESADLLITISESIKNFFPEKYKRNIHVIRNGFNSNKIDFQLIKTNKDQFILAYLGSVYSGQLEDFSFFNAIRKFIDRYKISPDKFLLKFIGSDNSQLNKIIKRFNLGAYTEFTAKMPIEQAYHELYTASMFFHLRYGHRKEVITTKQYEYLAFQKPILLPINDHGDLEESIKKYDAGFVCNSEEEIINILKMVFDNHFNGNPMYITRTEEELYAFSRQSQEEKLIKLIDKL